MEKYASEEMRKRIETRLGEIRQRPSSNKALRSYTAVLALKYRDGVILAADRRTSSGDYVWSDSSNKITKLSEFSASGHSGTVAAINWINEIYKSELEHFRTKTGDEIPLANQIRLLSNIVSIVSLILPDDFYSKFLVAGFDDVKNRMAIVEIDWYLGAKYVHKTFGAIGSGEVGSLGVLKDHFQLEQKTAQETDEQTALRLALKALKSAAEEVHVSPPEIAPPNIVIITAEDYRSLSEDEVEKLFETFHLKRRRKWTTK